MKTLCSTLLGLLAVAACLAGGASADSNNLTLNETQAPDGSYQIDITVTYVFPGQPPRQANTGVGTVRFTLPGADITLNPSLAADPGYTCALDSTSAGASSATCSSEGVAQGGGGLAFNTTMTVHLLSKGCWSPSNPGAAAGSANVWASPYDPGTAPDVTLPIDTGADCSTTTVQQPVLDTKPLTCTVPSLKGVSLVSATRRLANAKCARGKVAYKRSKSVKAGHVISQLIKPGTVRPEKTKVSLVVSRGQ